MKNNSVTVKQIQDLDRVAIEEYGVPSIALMENAGRAVALEILLLVKRVKIPRVCVVCGLGNNAGDGFVIARHLINAGVNTQIFLVGEAKNLKNDATVNYQILNHLNYPIKELNSANHCFLKEICNADVVVDAIFGVGIDREITNPFQDIIEKINQSAKQVVSVDIPSGLDGTTGEIYGVCIAADVTITFTFAKKGFYQNQGLKHTGKIIIADIGIPIQLKQYKNILHDQ